MWVIFFVNNAISVEVRWKNDGARCRALTESLVDVHFRRWGREERVWSPWEEDDRLVDGTRDSPAVGRHGGHDYIARIVCHWPGGCTTRRT